MASRWLGALPATRRLSVLSSARVQGDTSMIIGNPFWSYPIALSDTDQPAKPLMAAMKALPDDARPFRIVSHDAIDGRVFNCSFFKSNAVRDSFFEWYATNALAPGSAYHHCLTESVSTNTELPTRDTLLFGCGTAVLDDTRFGEYQLGMAVRYSVGKFLDAQSAEEARRVGCDPSFEQRIAKAMLDEGISYFGRLVMQGKGAQEWVTASRFGSMEDAQRATEVVQRLMEPEMKRWFSRYDSIFGIASRVQDFDD